MVVREVMNSNIQTVSPGTTIVEAAAKMRDGDFGVLPVLDGENIVGMLTDRDITVRIVADAKDYNTVTVEDAMTPDILFCTDEDEVQKVSQLMAERQVRRLPVVDKNKKLVGIVSVGDVAIYNQDQAAEALGGISEQRHDDPGASVRH